MFKNQGTPLPLHAKVPPLPLRLRPQYTLPGSVLPLLHFDIVCLSKLELVDLLQFKNYELFKVSHIKQVEVNL